MRTYSTTCSGSDPDVMFCRAMAPFVGIRPDSRVYPKLVWGVMGQPQY